MPSLALLLLGGEALACVLTAVHAAPLDAAYRASPESGRGVLAARPAHVMAADSALAIAWMASLPVAVVTTLLAASALDRFRAEGAARVVAHLTTVLGLSACVAGLVVAALGAVQLL
jgi:ABC-type transporter Mla maintaining outer membrane lipid asymmetry permease subunit MlaE